MERDYWIIVVEVELFGAQAWIKGTLDSSESTGVTLVPLKADIVDGFDSEKGELLKCLSYRTLILFPLLNSSGQSQCLNDAKVRRKIGCALK